MLTTKHILGFKIILWYRGIEISKPPPPKAWGWGDLYTVYSIGWWPPLWRTHQLGHWTESVRSNNYDQIHQ